MNILNSLHLIYFCEIKNRTGFIGQGAYGIVYRATQRGTGNTVAIKRIPFADSTPEGGVPCNVIREISLLRELDHPNVVKLLDVIQAQPGGLYLVFEFVAHDLKTFMDQYQTSNDISERVGLPVPMVRSFMKQILQGVGFCHTYRVLHRDLKPHNVRKKQVINMLSTWFNSYPLYSQLHGLYAIYCSLVQLTVLATHK